MQPPSVDASPRKRGLARRPLIWVLLVTYETFEMGLVQVMNPRLPWTKTITASGLFTAFSLSVQNGPVGLSYVVCTIREDGKVLNANKTAGPFHIASCDATRNLS